MHNMAKLQNLNSSMRRALDSSVSPSVSRRSGSGNSSDSENELDASMVGVLNTSLDSMVSSDNEEVTARAILDIAELDRLNNSLAGALNTSASENNTNDNSKRNSSGGSSSNDDHDHSAVTLMSPLQRFDPLHPNDRSGMSDSGSSRSPSKSRISNDSSSPSGSPSRSRVRSRSASRSRFSVGDDSGSDAAELQEMATNLQNLTSAMGDMI
jgi:hypothetical protein